MRNHFKVKYFRDGSKKNQSKNKLQCYFMYVKESKAIKIGVSVDPINRLSSIQTGNPHKVKLLGGLHKGKGKNYEDLLHQYLFEYPMEGEWFRAEEEVLEYVNFLIKYYSKGKKSKIISFEDFLKNHFNTSC